MAAVRQHVIHANAKTHLRNHLDTNTRVHNTCTHTCTPQDKYSEQHKNVLKYFLAEAVTTGQVRGKKQALFIYECKNKEGMQ